jgi:hypothetical protein
MPIRIKRLPVFAAASVGVFAFGLASAVGAAAQAMTFTFTGGEQAYVVPAGVTEVEIDAIGAAGGIGCLGTTGGLGGEITADFAVSPGSVLYVEVGGAGTAVERSPCGLTVQAAMFCSAPCASSHVARTSRGVL